MGYFVTHVHPDHPLVEDKESYIKKMYSVGIEKMVVVPITYDYFQSLKLFSGEVYPNILFAKGLHPNVAEITYGNACRFFGINE